MRRGEGGAGGEYSRQDAEVRREREGEEGQMINDQAPMTSGGAEIGDWEGRREEVGGRRTEVRVEGRMTDEQGENLRLVIGMEGHLPTKGKNLHEKGVGIEQKKTKDGGK